jgi:NCS1 family nucleobase:cation symporter-1
MNSQDGRSTGYGIEEHSIDYIPTKERHGAVWRQGPFWFLGDFNFFTVAMGYIGPSLGLNFRATCLASILGVLFGTLFMAFHASQGPELGIPQMIQSRAQFGYRGVLLPLFAALFTFLGFNVVDTYLVGHGLHSLYGWDVSGTVSIVTVGVIILAIFGYDWLHRVFLTLFWMALPFYILLSIEILNGHISPQPSRPLGFSWVAFSAQFAACASYNITFAPYVSDYTRYLRKARSRWPLILNVYWGASLSSIWLIVIGAWLACYLGATDGMIALNDVGNRLVSHGGVALVGISVAALIAAMAMNAYSGMLTVVTAIDSFVRITPTKAIRLATVMALAIVWHLLADTIQSATAVVLSNALVLMLYLLVPWTAINLVDYFLIRRGQYAITDIFRLNGVYKVWAWRGIVAYTVGFVVTVPFFLVPGLFEGPLAKRLGDVDVSWAVGLLVTGILYYVLMLSLDLTKETVFIRASEQELDH